MSKYVQPVKKPNGMGAVVKKGNAMDDLKMSVAGISKSQMDEVKTSGVKTRGNGCATKGTMARGPLA
jgi:adenine deaminase